MQEELRYSRGLLSVEQIQQEITKFWAELETSQEIQAELAAEGISRDILPDNLKDAITVGVDSSGVDPVSVTLIIAFAPTGNRILKDVWNAVLLPRIRHRWGDNAINDKKRGHA